ncbi:MAG: hypothetical protein E4G90_03165, partial [Gemmatimonadales bacterium]
MPLLPFVGHETARSLVAGAVKNERLPRTLLINGPAGVGKQRFALWVAQLLVCAGPGPEPCGTCPPCRKVLGLTHADVHWFVPIARPKASDPEKAVEEAENSLGEVMADRRENPLWTAPDGMASHAVASARLLLRKATLTSVEGGPKVFIIGDAERLVPQESSPEAANALLKIIEEPPRATYFILTATDPSRLLPTIRSRAVPLRLGALKPDQVSAFLAEHAGDSGASPDRSDAARGSIGLALADSGSAAKAHETATALLAAVLDPNAAPLEQALRQRPWQARGEFSSMLEALAETLGNAARQRSLQDKPVKIGGAPLSAGTEALVQAVAHVEQAREAAQGNVNPQLLLAVLAGDLEEVL